MKTLSFKGIFVPTTLLIWFSLTAAISPLPIEHWIHQLVWWFVIATLVLSALSVLFFLFSKLDGPCIIMGVRAITCIFLLIFLWLEWLFFFGMATLYAAFVVWMAVDEDFHKFPTVRRSVFGSEYLDFN